MYKQQWKYMHIVLLVHKQDTNTQNQSTKFPGPFLEQKSSYSNGSHSKYSFSHNFELHHHLELVSNRILMSCQPHRVNLGQTRVVSKPCGKRSRGTQSDVNTPGKQVITVESLQGVTYIKLNNKPQSGCVFYLFLLHQEMCACPLNNCDSH